MVEEAINLGYLGKTFQLKLIKEIIFSKDTDSKSENFGEDIIGLIQTSYFDDDNTKKVFIIIKNYFDKYGKLPNPDNIEQIINTSISDELDKTTLKAILKKILEFRKKIQTGEIENDSKYIKDQAWNFIRQQEFKKVIEECKHLLESGNVDNAGHITELFKKALSIGDTEDFGMIVNTTKETNLDNILEMDSRDVIPTGIKKLDEIMNGGLGKGQMGMLLAGQGVGKTTTLSLLANNAVLAGYNVLQIIFEDTEKDIHKKHIAKWIDIRINELPKMWKDVEGKKEVLKRLKRHNEKYDGKKGLLTIKRFGSENMTVPKLEKYIKALEKKLGLKFDLLVLDYIDCLDSHKRSNASTWDAQMDVAKALESMTGEINIATWTGVQGKKESNDRRILTMNDCGGSVEKLKKSHFIMSIGRDLDQKKDKRANLAILKSRFSDDGYVWEDIILDNGLLKLELDGATENVTDFDSYSPTSINNSFFNETDEPITPPQITIPNDPLKSMKGAEIINDIDKKKNIIMNIDNL